MSQGSLDPKIRFLGQKVCSVAHMQTDTQTDTKVITEDTLSGFQEFFLQPIIKDRSNIYVSCHVTCGVFTIIILCICTLKIKYFVTDFVKATSL